MNSLNSTQKNSLKSFLSIVGSQVPEGVSIDLLKGCKWDINTAVDQFFTRGYGEKYSQPAAKMQKAPSQSSNVNETNIKTMFKSYSNTEGVME